MKDHQGPDEEGQDEMQTSGRTKWKVKFVDFNIFKILVSSVSRFKGGFTTAAATALQSDRTWHISLITKFMLSFGGKKEAYLHNYYRDGKPTVKGLKKS